MAPAEQISILIAEDKEVLRLGLRHVLGGIAGCEVIAEALDGRMAIDKAVAVRPTIVFMKRDLPVVDGVRATQQIKKQCPTVGVIMLISKESDFWTSVDSGADGYILRETPEQLLATVIETVAQGGCWIGPLIAQYLLHGEGLPMVRSALAQRVDMPSLSCLTRREKEVLRLLTDGLSNRKMADALELEVQTIKVHVRNIVKKLHVNGRSDAISKVLKTGLSI